MASAWQPALEDRQLRLLALSLLASLVLHALLLYALPILRQAREQIPARPMTARLAEPKPNPPEPLVPRAELAPLKSQARRPEPRAESAAAAAPQPATVAAPSVMSIEPSREAPESAPRVPAAPPAPLPTLAAAAPRPDPLPAAAAPAIQDSGTLLQYRLEIMDLARRYKRYPRLAQDNNWEGRVEVRMVIGANGTIVSLSVKTSAGFESLDQEALAMLRKAKSAASIPQALRGREFTLEVPVIFSLKDERSG